MGFDSTPDTANLAGGRVCSSEFQRANEAPGEPSNLHGVFAFVVPAPREEPSRFRRPVGDAHTCVSFSTVTEASTLRSFSWTFFR
jgi:hypothetical protein